MYIVVADFFFFFHSFHFVSFFCFSFWWACVNITFLSLSARTIVWSYMQLTRTHTCAQHSNSHTLENCLHCGYPIKSATCKCQNPLWTVHREWWNRRKKKISSTRRICNTEWKRERRARQFRFAGIWKDVVFVVVHRLNATFTTSAHQATTFTSNSLASLASFANSFFFLSFEKTQRFLCFGICCLFFRLWLFTMSFLCVLRFLCLQVETKQRIVWSTLNERKRTSAKRRDQRVRQRREKQNRVRFSCVSFLEFPSRGVFWRLDLVGCDDAKLHFELK